MKSYYLVMMMVLVPMVDVITMAIKLKNDGQCTLQKGGGKWPLGLSRGYDQPGATKADFFCASFQTVCIQDVLECAF